MWGPWGHFGVWEGPGTWGPIWKGISSHLNDKAELLCTIKLKPEFATFCTRLSENIEISSGYNDSTILHLVFSGIHVQNDKPQTSIEYSVVYKALKVDELFISKSFSA